MGQRIGEILVRDGACTQEAVREALQNQVIFGGRLGTNLLELGAVTEEALALALGERHGIPSLHGNLPIDERVTALVRPDVADRCEVVPYYLADRKLALLVCDPSDLGMLDEVAFASGKQVHPIVVPEARVWALLRKAYGIDRQLRGIDVDWAKLEVRPGGPAAPAHATAAAAEAASAGLDLMAESEFEAMYGAGPGGAPGASPADAGPAGAAPPAAGRPAPPAGLRGPPAAAPPPAAHVPPPEEETVLDLTDLVVDSPLEEGVPDLRAEAFQPLGEPLAPGPAVLEALSRAPGRAPPARLDRPATRPAEEPEPTPVGFDEAVRLLQGVDDRSAIARTVLRYARTKFRRALLLTVNRGAAQGWAGLGEKLSREAVARVRLRLGTPGIVETVVSTRAHFLGPIPKTEANVRLLKQLGGGVPGNAFLVPILVRGRVVNVFYADNGKGAMVDAANLGELLILATRIAQGYDALLGRAA